MEPHIAELVKRADRMHQLLALLRAAEGEAEDARLGPRRPTSPGRTP